MFHFFKFGLSAPWLMRRRNATVLIIMSLVLACLSQGGDVSLSLGIKASISKAPYGECQCSVHTHCTQCVLHVTRQLPHFLPSSLWSLLIFRSMSMETLARYTSDSLHDVTMKKSCLAGLFSFFFTCGFLKSLYAFIDGNKDCKLGLCVFLGVCLICHLATPDNLQERLFSLRVTCSLFLSFFLAFAFFSY